MSNLTALRSLTNLATVSVILGSAAAQARTPSVLQINADFHLAELSTEISNPSTPATPSSIRIATASGTLRNDLTFSITGSEHVVNSGRQISNGPDTGAGTYTVTPASELVLDGNPTNPGTDIATLFLDADASMLVATRATATIESRLTIGLRKSSGQTVGSLSGSYFLASNSLDYGATGLTSRGTQGIAVADGLGGITFSGQEEVIDASGASQINPVTFTATYAVAPDGALSVSPTQSGGIAPNGDVFFLANSDPVRTEVGLTIGVRIGASYDVAMLAGDWGFGGHEIELGTDPTLFPDVYTAQGLLRIAATSPTSGTFAVEDFEVENSPAGIQSQIGTTSGTVSLGTNGQAALLDPQNSGITLTFSPTGSFFLGTEFAGVSNLYVGLRICGGSGSYGTGTPGTGAAIPVAGMSGFPTLGNPTFGLRVVDGVGGAAAIMPLAFLPTAGLPVLGGLVWIDPGRVVFTPLLLLSGPLGTPGAGQGSLSLPIPILPPLVGMRLYAQAFVLDQGAAAGLSMTDGFRLQVGR